MLELLKFGGAWQIWNVTCDGSVVVENYHRNMGFFRTLLREEEKALLNVLKTIRPAFSLSNDFTEVLLGSDLQKSPKGFHVFDYLQLQEAGIDIRRYVRGIDFRPGSLVVFKARVFTGDRIADELDTYPGRLFLTRNLKDGRPEPLDPVVTSKVIIPSRRDARNALLEMNWEFPDGRCKASGRGELEKEIRDYMNVYCYPALDLRIHGSRHRRSRTTSYGCE